MRLNKGVAYTPKTNGYFLSDKALAIIIANSEAETKRLKLELNKVSKERDIKLHRDLSVCNLTIKSEQDKYKLLFDTREIQKKIYLDIIADSKSKWYESPYLHFVMGVVVTTGVVIGITQLK